MSEANKSKLSGKTTLREIFETATGFERVAHQFYADLVPKVSKNLRYLVEELAEEEQGHIDLFSGLANNPEVEAVMAREIARPVADGKFSDCVQVPDLGENPDDQEVLHFLFLANEETKHKAELEAIYYKIVHSGGV
ncbi:MAG: hypothetical protein P8X66_16455 [Maritimibacter sp.]